jgi:superfamily II DNA/RNA helicase/HKD family nuclease
MPTKFFTNTGDNTLLNKFEGIFTHMNVHYFDALVGYFRSSGYFRIRKHLTNVGKIRILAGINVDRLIAEAARKGLEFMFNSEITLDEFTRNLRDDIQNADYEREVEEGILQFIADVANKKIEVRAHPDKNIHAKIYIFRQKVEHEHAGYGAVITGSSNLTEQGIEKNIEFNVELRDYDDIKYALETFEKLWEESVSALSTDCRSLIKETYLNNEFTPFEIYIKLLAEYFGNSIEYDPESIGDLPKGYKKLAYQIDAVNDGYSKLLQHNGFFLADVVGLGKTIVAIIIAKKFYFSNGYRTKTLVIYPPALENAWKNTFHDFEVPNVDFITNGSIHKIKHPEDYDLIIVDEAHKFRSDESEMFNQLQKLCKTPRKRPGLDGSRHKKIILVTATPLNNKPEDIRNQLYLFQDAKFSTLEVGNLQHFFRPRIDAYRKLKKENDRFRIKTEVKKIYDEIRTGVLEPVIVRRTRKDISDTPEYMADLKKQGVAFPCIEPPRQILYRLDPELNSLYDQTVLLLKDTVNGIGYFRYQAIKYLKSDAKKLYVQADLISDQLAHIMRILLVKRIESSFHAFTMSLKRYRDANAAMLSMIGNNRIYVAPDLNVNDYILCDNEDELQKILQDADDPGLIRCFSADDFAPEFADGIKRDQHVLDMLYPQWERVKKDPKYDEFLTRIRGELFKKNINDGHKLVVFSESKETVAYLADRLRKDGFSRIITVDSHSISDRADQVVRNFDANESITRQENNYDILITTEVLAEGINLHRSNVILNYDIPWNATRLMQRIGRINRIGTPSSRIYIYNFIPTVETDSEIELNKKAFMKLQAFHSALGEDSQIYTRDEDFGTFGLFEKIPEEEKDERLEYLSFLRRFRDENPDWYRKITHKMPLRARTGRKDRTTRRQHTITFIKNNKRDCFYYIYDDFRLQELTFIEAVKIFKADVSERPAALHALHHLQVQAALKSFKEDRDLEAVNIHASIKLGPNEQRAIAFVNDCMKQEFVNYEECELFEKAKFAIRAGKFQKLPREIMALIKTAQQRKMPRAEVHRELCGVIEKYPLSVPEEMAVREEKPEQTAMPKHEPVIIISESFIEG